MQNVILQFLSDVNLDKKSLRPSLVPSKLDFASAMKNENDDIEQEEEIDISTII